MRERFSNTLLGAKEPAFGRLQPTAGASSTNCRIQLMPTPLWAQRTIESR